MRESLSYLVGKATRMNTVDSDASFHELIRYQSSNVYGCILGYIL